MNGFHKILKKKNKYIINVIKNLFFYYRLNCTYVYEYIYMLLYTNSFI